ncbi:hypothetical protein ASE63_24720 [Bosea sp. Root381]|nr:hypothetical protein ASE63_24720 [Bosea sp. Root381]
MPAIVADVATAAPIVDAMTLRPAIPADLLVADMTTRRNVNDLPLDNNLLLNMGATMLRAVMTRLSNGGRRNDNRETRSSNKRGSEHS